MHNACSFGHVEVTLLLLRHSADVNARDNWNYTPLHEAAIKGKVEVSLGMFVPQYNSDTYAVKHLKLSSSDCNLKKSKVILKSFLSNTM